MHSDESLEASGFKYRRKDIDMFFEELGYTKIDKDIDGTNFFYIPK